MSQGARIFGPQQPSLSVVLAAALALAACADEGVGTISVAGGAGQDSFSVRFGGDDLGAGGDRASDGGQADAQGAATDGEPAAVDGDGADAGNGVGGGDSAATDCPGAVGCLCASADDCDTGICLEGMDGKVCAATCLDECPKGATCATLPGSDIVQACVSTWARLCSPCTTNNECNPPGVTTARCLLGAEGMASCGSPCADDSGCPAGYACESAQDVTGASSKQCVPVADGGGVAACVCSANAVALGLQAICTATVVVAGKTLVCGGTASCQQTGAVAVCTALEPSAEVCDGVDNDCSGQADDGACDDSNSCTTDSCDATAGAAAASCVHTPLGAGAPCDADGSVCTVADACNEGACVAGSPLDCDDQNPCTQDSCELAKGCTQVVFDGVPCSDDNPCTVGDVCKGGACAAGVAKTCTAPGPCVAAACDVATGKCTYPKLATGLPCDDGNACTGPDACADAFCVGGVVSCDDGNPCTDDGCAADKGCNSAANAAGCDDGDACTQGDVCAQGACAGVVLDCDDGNACTADGCDKAKGCTAAAVADKSPCGSGSSAWCVAGSCVSKNAAGEACDGPGACASGFCVEGVCCDGACGGGCESCLAAKTGSADGVCKPIEAGTDPNNACIEMAPTTCGFTGACDGKGQCEKYAIGTPCADASCSDGVLTKAGTCGVSGCNKGAIVQCDDGDACTVGDGCEAGACTSGSKKSCDDGNACTTDGCDAKKGCVFAPNSAPCSDGNVCTLNDACAGGSCKPGAAKTCNDGNPCTDDGCNAFDGCVAFPNAAACDDGNPCTVNDACGGGSCKPGAPKSCDDGVACTADSCAGGVCKHDSAGCCTPTPVSLTFEDGAAGWTFSNSGGPTRGWQHAANAKLAHSPPAALYYGDQAVWNFNWGTNSGTARSPLIAVPAGKSSNLSLWLYMQVESLTAYDQLTVYILHNGSKKAVFNKTSAGGTGKWVNPKVDTTSYGGGNIQVELYFNTVDSIANSSYGIFVDDIVLNVACGS